MASITSNSLNKFCPNDRIAVFGFYNCGYEPIQEFFRRANKKVFSWKIGEQSAEFSSLTENKINPLFASTDARSYKNALVHLVLDNYRRELKGEAITPLIFCIDIDQNYFHPPTAEDIFSKDAHLNSMLTHKELRRIAKLCFDKRIPLDMRETALKTFKYVRVQLILDQANRLQGIDLQELPTPVTETDFALHTSKRRGGRPTSQVGPSMWRDDLEKGRQEILDAAP